jgi:TatD DNase family protein
VELVDTHCHLDLNKFDEDRNDVILRAQAAGLNRILIPGINISSSREAVKLAESFPMLYACIGVQPNDSLSWESESINDLKILSRSETGSHNPTNKKIVAVGEIGLDYYWEAAPQQHQKMVLKEQLGLAGELGLPVVLHLREKQDADHGDCAEDLMEMISSWMNHLKITNNPICDHPGVVHSFSGDMDTAQKAIRLGFYIGVTGPVTFTNARKRQELIAAIPLKHLLLETDAPFLTPHPKRGQRNEPANVRLVAEKVAEIHHETLARVAEQTCKNANLLFNW